MQEQAGFHAWIPHQAPALPVPGHPEQEQDGPCWAGGPGSAPDSSVGSSLVQNRCSFGAEAL